MSMYGGETDAKQLDLDGVEAGHAYKVKITAKRALDGERPEGDPAIAESLERKRTLTYSVRAGTWREAVDKAMDLYPRTDEDGTRYTVTVEEA